MLLCNNNALHAVDEYLELVDSRETDLKILPGFDAYHQFPRESGEPQKLHLLNGIRVTLRIRFILC